MQNCFLHGVPTSSLQDIPSDWDGTTIILKVEALCNHAVEIVDVVWNANSSTAALIYQGSMPGMSSAAAWSIFVDFRFFHFSLVECPDNYSNNHLCYISTFATQHHWK